MFNNPLSGHIDTFYIHKNDKYGTAYDISYLSSN